jgi:hypothetical protein
MTLPIAVVMILLCSWQAEIRRWDYPKIITFFDVDYSSCWGFL